MEATQSIEGRMHVWQTSPNGTLDDGTVMGMDIFYKRRTHSPASTLRKQDVPAMADHNMEKELHW